MWGVGCSVIGAAKITNDQLRLILGKTYNANIFNLLCRAIAVSWVVREFFRGVDRR